MHCCRVAVHVYGQHSLFVWKQMMRCLVEYMTPLKKKD